MIIPVPIGTECSVEVTGSRLIPIHCKYCACDFAYLKQRDAKASSVALLGINKAGAEQEASKSAVDKLNQQLEKDHDAVACPSCGMFQKDMLRIYKKNKLGMYAVLWFLMSIPVTFLYIFIVVTQCPDSPWLSLIRNLYFIIFILIVIKTVFTDPNIHPDRNMKKHNHDVQPLFLKTELEKLVQDAQDEGITIEMPEWDSDISIQ